MTVDSEAIFALAEHAGARPARARGAARLDGRGLDRRARAGRCSSSPAASAGRSGSAPAGTSSSSPRRATRSRSSSSTSAEAAQARGRRGHDPRLEDGRIAARSTASARPDYLDQTALPAVRAPQEGVSCLAAARGDRAAAALAAASDPSGRTVDALLARAARGRGTGTPPTRRGARRTSGRPATRSAAPRPLGAPRPSRRIFGRRPSLRASAAPCSTARSSRSSPTGDVEAGLAQRIRRASRTCASRATSTASGPRRASMSRAVGVRPSSSPSSRSRPRSSSRVAKRRGTSPAARLAAFHVPKCSITVCGCTVVSGSAANSPSSATGRAARRTHAARARICSSE